MNAPVIIVGGGPVGLTLALGLARYGVASTIIERDASAHRESRAVVIWPRTVEILRDWNVFEPLRAAGRFQRVFSVCNAKSGKITMSADFECIGDVFDDPGFLLIPQYETERVLRELVAASPLCSILAPASVTSLRQNSQFVDVHYRIPEGARTIRGAYVVGCDGAHGIVRSAIGLTLEGMTYGSRVVLSDERVGGEIVPDTTARVRLDLPGVLAAFHVENGLWRIIAAVPKEQSDEAALSESVHRERLQALLGDVPAQTEWKSIFNIHKRHAKRFLIGRVAIAGDAAHLNSPAGGQGMNAGIQDAANIAWKLAAAVAGPAGADALMDSYDIERREMVTDTVERYTNRLTRVGLGFSRRARTFAIRTVGRAVRGVGMQRKLCRSMGMLTGRYTQSPIVDARHPLAGRRIDDIALPDGRRINQVRAGEAVVIAVGAERVAGAAIHVPNPPKRWHVKPPVALIVRPDGCVAAVVEKPVAESVRAAWDRAFSRALPFPAVDR